MNTGLTSSMKGASGLSKIINQSFRLAKLPIIISSIITPVRFLLELAGLSENIIFIIGLLWLTLVFAIYWGIKLHDKQNSFLLIILSLVIFSPISRIPVFILWWIDINWEIGSHYGLFYTNWIQAFTNHIFGGALVQIIPGSFLGFLTLAIMKYRKSINK